MMNLPCSLWCIKTDAGGFIFPVRTVIDTIADNVWGHTVVHISCLATSKKYDHYLNKNFII